ncbi:MAG: cytochrome oxidase [Nitrospirae bacterium CG18_big_fil_WC_8_21_14_2_50_70_55]|nr:cytochrome oxidase [Deltaproteobacteria bacterium]OIP63775.1 MAG: cytochrome oxidase [Nitrospirae bacterium CG2_30_70_394]PIQ03065.1 MAG: cytochrome oxidase [Nitrospirae bacterium CG18_big_fil_WC_8_21_14_2_50_70_55]PIU77874.1 MAG: cytochrome oxidase [Nitrospirae bacterium CG06_land_8_20_14_3_00_70_43]PIW83565.1 MAG: cytochrome oxidase [Nitrospirae bacterium CG_4_8_14_3_um_filter_70_85]PIX84118.1 MAG: cytochrome oxidase [Nitrospirae bacterium CG_4_10_14_3_um_filter_70_108]PJB94670.1 MAG: cy
MASHTATRPLVDEGLVKAFFVAAMVWFFVSILGGFFFSLQFLQAYPFPNSEWLSPGRVRMTHTNTIAYGFLVNGLLGGLCWAIPRLTGRPLLFQRLSWLLFWVWQGIVVLTFTGILAGHAQALEWGETPTGFRPGAFNLTDMNWAPVDILVVVGFLLVSINFYTPIIRSKSKAMYVSLWYFSAGLVWTALTYVMGNFFPEYFLPGASGAAVTGLFIHDLVGLFVTPMGWGLMYYFVPIILNKPIWSHGLSLIGFWALAFFYPLNGVHHFLWSPIPMYAQYGAVISTIAVEVVVTTVVVNFFATIVGSGQYLRDSLPIRWFYTAMIFYFTTCLQCAVQVTLTVQKIIHFTDWVVGHSHLIMFGVFGFWIIGVMVHLWPKLTGNEWYNPRLNHWHFWLSSVGMFIMFWDLIIAGLIQGYEWQALAPWEQSLISSAPFWLVRTVSGTMIIVGQFIFAYNMWMTARGARSRLYVAAPQAA